MAFGRKLGELAGLDLSQFTMPPQPAQGQPQVGGQQGAPQMMGAAQQAMPGLPTPGNEVPAMASPPNQALRVVGRDNQSALAGM